MLGILFSLVLICLALAIAYLVKLARPKKSSLNAWAFATLLWCLAAFFLLVFALGVAIGGFAWYFFTLPALVAILCGTVAIFCHMECRNRR